MTFSFFPPGIWLLYHQRPERKPHTKDRGARRLKELGTLTPWHLAPALDCVPPGFLSHEEKQSPARRSRCAQRPPHRGPRQPCWVLAGQRDHAGAFGDPPAVTVPAPMGGGRNSKCRLSVRLVRRETHPRRDGKGPVEATCYQRNNGPWGCGSRPGRGGERREVNIKENAEETARHDPGVEEVSRSRGRTRAIEAHHCEWITSVLGRCARGQGSLQR